MAVTPELASQIERELSELKKSDLRRLGTSMNRFMDDFSKILAQTETDQTALVNAGFDASTMPRSRALLELLSLTYGERRGLAPVTAENRAHFDQQMALATLDRKRLSVVCAHIADACRNKRVQQNYRLIAQGNGNIRHTQA
jgi:hypothetical protein